MFWKDHSQGAQATDRPMSLRESVKDLRESNVFSFVLTVRSIENIAVRQGDNRCQRVAAKAAGAVASVFAASALVAQSISNGGFEHGLGPGSPPAQWAATRHFYHWTNPNKAHSGSQYACFGLGPNGMMPLTNASGSLEQTMNLLADAAPATSRPARGTQKTPARNVTLAKNRTKGDLHADHPSQGV